MIASTDNARIPLSPRKCLSFGSIAGAPARLSTPAIPPEPPCPGSFSRPRPRFASTHSYLAVSYRANPPANHAAWLDELLARRT